MHFQYVPVAKRLIIFGCAISPCDLATTRYAMQKKSRCKASKSGILKVPCSFQIVGRFFAFYYTVYRVIPFKSSLTFRLWLTVHVFTGTHCYLLQIFVNTWSSLLNPRELSNEKQSRWLYNAIQEAGAKTETCTIPKRLCWPRAQLCIALHHPTIFDKCGTICNSCILNR